MNISPPYEREILNSLILPPLCPLLAKEGIEGWS